MCLEDYVARAFFGGLPSDITYNMFSSFSTIIAHFPCKTLSSSSRVRPYIIGHSFLTALRQHGLIHRKWVGPPGGGGRGQILLEKKQREACNFNGAFCFATGTSYSYLTTRKGYPYMRSHLHGHGPIHCITQMVAFSALHTPVFQQGEAVHDLPFYY